jgi:hypothetical protein
MPVANTIWHYIVIDMHPLLELTYVIYSNWYPLLELTYVIYSNWYIIFSATANHNTTWSPTNMIWFVRKVGGSGKLKWNSVQGGMRMQIRKAEQVQGEPNHLDPH